MGHFTPCKSRGNQEMKGYCTNFTFFFILVIIGDTVPCKLICFSEIGKVLESLNLLVLPEKPVLDRSERLTGRMHVEENALVLNSLEYTFSLSLDPQCKNCQAPSDVVKDTRPLCGCTRKDTWPGMNLCEIKHGALRAVRPLRRGISWKQLIVYRQPCGLFLNFSLYIICPIQKPEGRGRDLFKENAW